MSETNPKSRGTLNSALDKENDVLRSIQQMI